MLDLSKIFDAIEKVAYDILIWILLVPKTLAQIVVNPRWVPGYVTKEIGEEGEKRFDDYLSPVILLLIAALIPYLIFLLTPLPGVVIESTGRISEYSIEAEAGTALSLQAIPDFKSDTGEYKYKWDIYDGSIVQKNEGQSGVLVVWKEPALKYVSVTVTNDKGESLRNTYFVSVRPEGEKSSAVSAAPPSSSNSDVSLAKELQGEGMVIPTLIVLSLPMMFAIATEAFRGYPLMRSTLKRSFYIQCYYFAPVILVMWSVILGGSYLVTPSEIWVSYLSIAVLGYMLLWLIAHETILMHNERKPKVKAFAFAIVIACFVLIGVMFYLVVLFTGDFEVLRQALEAVFVLTILGFLVRWLLMRNKRQASETVFED